jgi:dTDP-glucose 4,6-dehydratase
VTGGAGFIGSNLIRLLLTDDAEVEVTNLDLLTYAGNLENLREVQDDPRYSFVKGDICDGHLVRELMAGKDAVLHLAAESHVDRSISDPSPFVRTNVLGTQVLLDGALEAGVSRFVQVSTDEVYGELPWVDPEDPDTPRQRFTERTPLNPRSPYSASKAGGDLLALSYHITFDMDVVLVRGSNNYGPRQHSEKLIPLMTTFAMEGKGLPVYGDGLNVRDWIFVDDFCRGILAALDRGGAGEVYNFGGNAERTNLQVIRQILANLGVSEDLMGFVPDRRGHDRRYAMDFSKAREKLAWTPTRRFEDALAETVRWFRLGAS